MISRRWVYRCPPRNCVWRYCRSAEVYPNGPASFFRVCFPQYELHRMSVQASAFPQVTGRCQRAELCALHLAGSRQWQHCIHAPMEKAIALSADARRSPSRPSLPSLRWYGRERFCSCWPSAATACRPMENLPSAASPPTTLCGLEIPAVVPPLAVASSTFPAI